jgi:hypothetical protein
MTTRGGEVAAPAKRTAAAIIVMEGRNGPMLYAFNVMKILNLA